MVESGRTTPRDADVVDRVADTCGELNAAELGEPDMLLLLLLLLLLLAADAL